MNKVISPDIFCGEIVDASFYPSDAGTESTLGTGEGSTGVSINIPIYKGISDSRREVVLREPTNICCSYDGPAPLHFECPESVASANIERTLSVKIYWKSVVGEQGAMIEDARCRHATGQVDCVVPPKASNRGSKIIVLLLNARFRYGRLRC